MKKIFSLLAIALASATAFAGGLNTNTNQNAAYVRQMSQSGIIDITGLYANPAGTAFLSKGWHLSLNSQSAWQQRNVATTCPLFALNTENPSMIHEFNGRAKAPVIPSFSVSYNDEKWSVSAHFGLVGGGGKCEFATGLGSFEALYANQMYQQVPVLVSLMAPAMIQGNVIAKLTPVMGADMAAATAAQVVGAGVVANGELSGYSLNGYMSGRSYMFGLQIGGTYKVHDNVSLYGGIRFLYGTNNYQGHVNNIVAKYAGSYQAPGLAMLQQPTTGNIEGERSLDDSAIELNADQSAFGVTPILGIDWKVNEYLNLGAKYEFQTKMIYTNSTKMNEYTAQAAQGNATLGQFVDGGKVREDVPAILSAGAMLTPVKCFRLMGGWTYYFDKAVINGVNNNLYESGVNFEGMGGKVDGNTMEFNVGAEYDICKYLTVSFSWQNTIYNISDKGMNDLSFNNSNNMIGCGFRVNPCNWINIDLGYMHTMYKDRTVGNVLTDGIANLYNRKNDVFGIGINFNL